MAGFENDLDAHAEITRLKQERDEARERLATLRRYSNADRAEAALRQPTGREDIFDTCALIVREMADEWPADAERLLQAANRILARRNSTTAPASGGEDDAAPCTCQHDDETWDGSIENGACVLCGGSIIDRKPPASDARLGARTTASADAPPLVFVYRNHRGEAAERRVRPLGVRYGSTEWHPEPQWLLRAHDLEKDAEREFAMKDIGARTTAQDGVDPAKRALSLAADRITAMIHAEHDRQAEMDSVRVAALMDARAAVTNGVVLVASPIPPQGEGVSEAEVQAVINSLPSRRLDADEARTALEAAAKVRGRDA